jgi:hypothetical protein
MTAQILLNILRHSIIKMEAINLLILDECHHAVKKHPYSLVMSEFYHTTPKEKRPSVFGMTASPVNLKGNYEDARLNFRSYTVTVLFQAMIFFGIEYLVQQLSNLLVYIINVIDVYGIFRCLQPSRLCNKNS